MECDICGVGRPRQSKFHCPACARAAVYSIRLDHARVLLEKSELGKRVEAVLSRKQGNPAAKVQDSTAEGDNAVVRKIKREQELADVKVSRERVETIHQKSEELRVEMQRYKDQLATTKLELSTRRDKLKTAHAELVSSKPVALDAVRKAVSKSRRRYGRVTEDLCHARSWLCHAAASISQVRRVSATQPTAGLDRDKQPAANEHHNIAGLSIPHLQDLNNVPLDQLNAVLSHIVRLLHLTCIYLAIRLPAEILPPSANSPMPAIRPPDSSYPASANSPSESFASTESSPTASRFFPVHPAPEPTKSKPRQRPLYVPQNFATSAKRLPALAKEDPKQFTLLIEGLAHLAWDIAWLCRSQSVDIGEDWQSICDIGRNLHVLLVEAAGRGQRVSTSHEKRGPDPKRTSSLNHEVKSTFGLRSHNSSAARLPSVADPNPDSGSGTLLSPQQLRLALRQHLLNEMQGAEWELLDEEDFGEEKGAAPGDVVLVGKGKRRAVVPLGGEHGQIVGRGVEGGLGIDTTGVEEGEEEILARTAYAEGSEREEVRKGNGWMKLKARR